MRDDNGYVIDQRGRHRDPGPPRNCDQCDKRIEKPADKWQRFCTSICRNRWHAARRVTVKKEVLENLIMNGAKDIVSRLKGRNANT